MTYNCTFKPTQTNGHWHLSQQEATRCIESWAKWNKPSKTDKTKQLINNKPNGTGARDGFNYGL